MVRRAMAIAVLLGLLAAVSSATEVQVIGGDLDDSRSTPTASGLTSVGGASLTLNWDIDISASDVWTYDYWFSGSDAPGTWYLEVSEGITMVSLAPVGGTAMSVIDNATISGKSFNNAIQFTGAGSSGRYGFQTFINPIWGDAFIGTVTSGKYAYNASFGTNPTQATADYTNWVAAVDTGPLGQDIVIPEPSLSILALGGLLAGAFGRRVWKKKEA